MHEPVKSQLENLLRGRVDAEAAVGVEAHLFACSSCATALEVLREQNGLFRSLRAPALVDPPAGFYSRVLRRIETVRPGFWSLLLEPSFGRRLAYATGSLAILMAALLLAMAPETQELAQTPVQILAAEPAPVFDSYNLEDVQQGRERFLVTLASFSE